MSSKLTNMADMNIFGFITSNSTGTKKLRQSIGIRVTKMTMPD
jgi:hypothetical protein